MKDNRGQGMVELLLVLAILLPLLNFVVGYTRSKFLPKVSNWFADEIRVQVRYGKSMGDPDFKIDNVGALASIEGDVPLKYDRTNPNGHPLINVQNGWQ